MNQHSYNLLLATMIFFSTGLPVSGATTVTLRERVTAASTVIRLGDVAEIESVDVTRARQLAALILMPAPAPGSQHYLRKREVEDLLTAHGQNLSELQFAGAGQVAINTLPTDAAEQQAAPLANQLSDSTTLAEDQTDRKPMNLHAAILAGHSGAVQGGLPKTVLAEEVQGELQQAIASYLVKTTGKPGPWEVLCTLRTGHITQLNAATSPLTCRGGRAPWTGRQRFIVSFSTPQGPVQMPVSAEITGQPSAVAVAVQPIARGAVITAADVELQEVESVPASGSHRAAIESLDALIGMEARQAIQPGSIVFTDQLQPPVVVKRGEVITVASQIGNLRVRTTARANQNGVTGELIQVESLETRERYDVRVTGPREAAVFAAVRSPVDEQPERPTRVVRH